jgi:probable rRNA maturation factor
MSYHVEVRPDVVCPVPTDALRRAAAAVLRAQGVLAGSSLTLVIADDETVRRLNARFRGVDAPTEVLSFPADPPTAPEAQPYPYLGDVIIAYPRATAEASRAGHSLEAELLLLTVHGTLHLLGFDHSTDAARARMWAAQAAALEAIGAPIT